jgi:hypothetical protein
MSKGTKLAALFGAAALMLGIAGTALAATAASDDGVTPTWHAGNITVDGKGKPASADCDAADAAEFDAAGDATTTNGVTVHMSYDSDTKAVGFTADGGVVLIAYVKGSDAYNEYDYGAGVASDGNLFAPDAGNSGSPAALSHAIFCTGPAAESEAPSFGGSVADITDQPTEPNTATIGTSNGGPTDSSWLFIAAIGVLLASVVVMTPARAKSKR